MMLCTLHVGPGLVITWPCAQTAANQRAQYGPCGNEFNQDARKNAKNKRIEKSAGFSDASESSERHWWLRHGIRRAAMSGPSS